jgi:arginine N-succinyltransferase
MIIVRPSRLADLPGIEKLVNESAAPLSTLPANRDKLAEKIEFSMRSFKGEQGPQGMERYLFVMEDTDRHEIIGTSGIDAHAGNGAPFYNYRLDSLFHSSQQLGVHNEVPILYLTHELSGKVLLCSLSIAGRYRDTAYFDLLSRARLLFIHAHANKFGERIIVEIQGAHDEHGSSPFWDSLGRHFFGMDFNTADFYSAVKSKTFIAEMMPAHPIYVPLLTDAAQKAIGEPHAGARKNFDFLRKEGLRFEQHIDIFDGGPTLEARIAELTTVRLARSAQVRFTEHAQGTQKLVSTTTFENFTAALCNMNEGLGDVVRIAGSMAEKMALREGDTILFSPL